MNMRCGHQNANDRHSQTSFSNLQDFDAAMRKLVTVPKGVVEQREVKWQVAKKKAAKKR